VNVLRRDGALEVLILKFLHRSTEFLRY
jgi:hypothetical protein